MTDELGAHEIARIARQINRSLTRRTTASTHPEAILVGGQPAAGKTGLISIIKQDVRHRHSVEINGDDLRSWHPHYWALLRENDALAADRTQKAVNFWVESLIDAATTGKRNILIEGTMRKPEVPLNTAARLKQHGYRVGLYLLAIPFWQSELRIFERYERQKEQTGYGRFSNLDVHLEAFNNFPKNLETLLTAGNVDFMRVFGRDMNGLKPVCTIEQFPETGKEKLISGTLELISVERNQPITINEYEEYQKVWEDVFQKMRHRNASKNEIQIALAVKNRSLERFRQ